MNKVLNVLCSDHANFGKLLNVIERQAEDIAAGNAPELTIMAQAVAYLEGYPTLYHHPLEDAVYWRLRAVQPDKAVDVAAVLYEHAAVRQLLTRLKHALIHFNPSDTVSAIRLAKAAQAFVDAQWLHMEYERTGLFQVAATNLTAADWAAIMEDVPRAIDPIFSTHIVIPALRDLHIRLLKCTSTREATNILRDVAPEANVISLITATR